MPKPSLCLPQFLHFRRSRSRSPKGSLPRPREDAATSHLSPWSSAAVATHPPLLDGPPSLESQAEPVSRQVTLIDVVDSDLVQMTAGLCTAASQSAFIPCPSVPQDSTQFQQTLYRTTGMFNQAHDFTVMGTFVNGNVAYNNTSSNQFMKEFLEKTILGAEFNSSAHNPPPRYHPGTRLDILQQCLEFIRDCSGEKKMCWVIGAAGVGKSAILQNMAESCELPVSYHASAFFSINRRNDGIKAIPTISYQFAAKFEPYRQLIEREIAHDPSLLQSSMSEQFTKFIIEPFVCSSELKLVGRVLVIIDGLDECDNHHNQLELLCLISHLCLTYPSSPLIWLIASRPESHITSFFSRRNVIPVYEKEEVPVDSDEGRADVERFLCDKLSEIREDSDSLDPLWPDEQDFWKLANAAGGLFAYAHTAIRYIGDSTIESPVSQFSNVLHVIDKHPMTNLSQEEHPMALLNALYAQILSRIPTKIMVNTQKLLVSLASCWDSVLSQSDPGQNFVVLCNWLGMTPDEAYVAMNHLWSVFSIPRRDQAHKDIPFPFHKSFIDYISDSIRSDFSPAIQDEAQQLWTQCTLKIFKEAPDGIDLGNAPNYRFRYGVLLRVPGAGDEISLTWPVEKSSGWTDNDTRLRLYKLAIGAAVAGMEHGDPVFQNEFGINLLTTRFKWYEVIFPQYQLCELVFDASRRFEFMRCGILEQMPLEAIEVSGLNSRRPIKLQFSRSSTAARNLSHPWNPSCQHMHEWEQGKVNGWMTTFDGNFCAYCFSWLQHQLESWKYRSPDHIVLVLSTSTGKCWVEVRFVDVEDGMSEWTYRFWYKATAKERKKAINIA